MKAKPDFYISEYVFLSYVKLLSFLT